MAGIVRAYEAAREFDLPLIIGSEMQIEDAPKLVLIAADLEGYIALCRLITVARRRAGKGEYRLLREVLIDLPLGLLALWLPERTPSDADAHWLRSLFPQIGCGSPSNFTAPKMMQSDWPYCVRSAIGMGCRWSPRVMSICMSADVERCRTR